MSDRRPDIYSPTELEDEPGVEDKAAGDRFRDEFGDEMFGEKPPMPPPPVEAPEKPPEPVKGEPAFEIVDAQKEAEEKEAAAIKELALKLKDGKFDNDSKKQLLDALNNGKNDAERRQNFNEYVRKVNTELKALNKTEPDPRKQFEIRYLMLRDNEGGPGFRIGLQNGRSPTYNDEFIVKKPKK
jgi:hypothetical protein